MPLNLYNTLTRRVEPFTPADPAHITFYSCGPTVYDDAHIGNFRSFLAADVLRRWVESPLCDLEGETPDQQAHRERHGRKVTHVMNITDVGHMTDDAEGGESGEDRMAVAGRRIAEAKKSGKLPADVAIDPNNPYQIARFYEDRFKDDARRLGLKLIIEADKDPTLNPRATDHIAGMIAVVQKLVERGFAYTRGEPGSRVVYFDVQKFPSYGKLSGNTLDQLREGAGGRIAAENQSSKKHPADFLLWKEDPRHIMSWPAEFNGEKWGPGYPGWHIECTVMSASRLLSPDLFKDLLAAHNAAGPVIDLHSGGEDNIFPHHECEIAQTCTAFMDDRSVADASRARFARHWFHPRFLLVEGTKMSKSKGNFFTARDLFAKGIEPAALRLELIKTHYRSNANFTMQGLEESSRRIQRWRRFAKTLQRVKDRRWERDPQVGELLNDFVRDMNSDLNAASAISRIDKFVQQQEELETILQEAMSGLDVDMKSYATSVQQDPLPPMPLPLEEAARLYSQGKQEKTNLQHWAALHLMDSVFGVIFCEAPASTTSDIGVFIGVDPNPDVNAKLEERRAARASKDFKKSDQIRDELKALGYAIKDVAGGKVEVTRA